MSIAPKPQDILQFLADNGAETTLVTLVAVEGSASRAVGTQMGVARDGRHCGSLSGGCIDTAVVAEALDVLATGQGRIVRFGAGSPYMDLKLPCGGSIDLMFTPRPAPVVVKAALNCLSSRRQFVMALSTDSIFAAPERHSGDLDTRQFIRTFHPQLRVVAIGQGDDLSAFVRLADGFGTDVIVVAPDRQLPDLASLANVTVFPVLSRNTLPPVLTDRWTAIIFLFHDRDWEEFLLPQALACDAFYHGAIGSPRTQAVRRQLLHAAGVASADAGKLRDTVGLIPSTRDPATLALSVLAELVSEYGALVARLPPGSDIASGVGASD